MPVRSRGEHLVSLVQSDNKNNSNDQTEQAIASNRATNDSGQQTRSCADDLKPKSVTRPLRGAIGCVVGVKNSMKE